jgi:predicted phosphodiesterase
MPEVSGGLRRLGLIGDIHGEDRLLERALEVLSGRGLDIILATGDIADGRGSVTRCCELLARYQVLSVRGNHERWFLRGSMRDLPNATLEHEVSPQARATLAALPAEVEIATVSGLALLCHGLGPNDMAKVLPDDQGYWLGENEDLQRLLALDRYRWVLNGHSHRRMVRDFAGLTIINAGTLCHDRDPCFLEVDFAQATVDVYTFDGIGQVREVVERVPLRKP